MTPEVYQAWLSLVSVAVVSLPQFLGLLFVMRAGRWARRSMTGYSPDDSPKLVMARGYGLLLAATWNHRAAGLARWVMYAALVVGVAQAVSYVKIGEYFHAFLHILSGGGLALLNWYLHRIELRNTANFLNLAELCKKQVSLTEGVP